MNPVLRKDLLALLRLKRVAAIQIFFVAVLGALVVTTWPQGGMMTIADTGQDNLLLGLIVGQLTLLVLFVPGVAAVSLTGEKEANTLEMLYASRLTPSQIISGKILSAISFPLMLLLSGLPFVAMLYWRGQVDVQKLMLAYVVLVLTAILLAIISLTISAVCRQSATALVFTYLAVLTVCGGLLVPAAIMLSGQSGTSVSAQILHYARSLSPVAAALALLRPALNDFGGAAHDLLPSWQVFLPLAVLVLIACFVVLVVRLRRPPISADAFGAPVGGMDIERSLGRKIFYLIDPKKRRKPFGSHNPLIAKEARTNNLRSGRWMIRIFYGSLFLSLGLAVMSLYGNAEYPDLLSYVAHVLVAFQIGVVALVDPSLTTSSVSSEIENGTFETLRMTPLRGGQIFWGKFIPAFFPAVLPIVALLPGYAAICVINTEYIQRLLYILPITVMAVVFCCTLGLACSSFVTNTARATVMSYIITAGLFVLPLFGWWASGTLLDPKLARWLAMPSPLVMALNMLPTFDPTKPTSSPQIDVLWPQHLWLMAGLCVALLIAARARLAVLLRQG